MTPPTVGLIARAWTEARVIWLWYWLDLTDRVRGLTRR